MPVHPSESERGYFRQQIAHNVSCGVDVADVGREDVARPHGNIGRDKHGDGQSHAGERSVRPGIHAVAGKFFRQRGRPFVEQARQRGVVRNFHADQDRRNGRFTDEFFQRLLHGGRKRNHDFGESGGAEVFRKLLERHRFFRRRVLGEHRGEKVAQTGGGEESVDLLQRGELRSGALAERDENFMLRCASQYLEKSRGAWCLEKSSGHAPGRCSLPPSAHTLVGPKRRPCRRDRAPCGGG